MLFKVALTATLAAALVLAPATLAHDVEFEVDSVVLANDELVAENAVAGRGLLARKVVSKKKYVVAKTPSRPTNAKKPAQITPKNGNNGDEGNEGNEGNEGTVQVACCSPREFEGLPYRNEGDKGTYTFTTTSTSRVNTISCSANADAQAVSAAKDAHVNAFAAAHKHACSQKNDPKWNGSIVSDWEKGAAFAVAKAITSAFAKCAANGNAYGCASASAAASAWAKATASAHASAVADATNLCNCKDAKAFAGAWASGNAEAFEAKIVADVSAKATAAVCVKSSGPGQSATAEVAVVAKCIEKKYAYVMADAQAKALLAGNCKHGLQAKAEIDALTSGTIVSKSNC